METTTGFYEGRLGVVLLFADRTRAKVLEAAAQYKDGNLIDLGGQHEPHLTLYHAELVRVPAEVIAELLEELACSVYELQLIFSRISPWNRFLFWDVKRQKELVDMHGRALSLARYFNRGMGQVEGGFSVLSLQERYNVEVFGNPLVNDLWRPHVTLGYYAEGRAMDALDKRFSGIASAIAFVQIGEMGTIAKVISRHSFGAK
ncbi:MAG: 2'-5' RNA ligase family protein [Candidatus Sungbacteria bacterium]|nr:2'-5' RNA ligase family protein [Candidatus Sungbacteria bacterium]